MSDENGVLTCAEQKREQAKRKRRKKVYKERGGWGGGDDARIDCVWGLLMGVVVGCKIDGGKRLCLPHPPLLLPLPLRNAWRGPLSSVRSVALLSLFLLLSYLISSLHLLTERENLLLLDSMQLWKRESAGLAGGGGGGRKSLPKRARATPNPLCLPHRSIPFYLSLSLWMTI